MESSFTPREQVVEVINNPFYSTDYQNWDVLTKEVFAENVLLDVVSLGAQKAELLSSNKICEMWKEGFKELDAIHHQAGNYLISISENSAMAKAYAIASHYKKGASNGSVREFVGSYDFHLVKNTSGWRIDEFKFNLKYVTGNAELD